MTNNPRIYLWIALALVLFLNYDAWMRDYGALPGASTPSSAQTAAANRQASSPAGNLANSIPQAPKAEQTPPPATAPSNTTGTVPAVAGATPSQQGATSAATGTGADASGGPAQIVHVRTDVLDLAISTRGGTIDKVDLLKYPKVKGEATPVRLENSDDPATVYLLQSGLTGPGAGPYPNHLATFSAAKSDYTLDGGNELRVPLTWTNNEGVTVTKTFTLHRGEYRVGVQYTVENHGNTPWEAAPYMQILRNDPRTKRSMFNVESYAFHGPAIYDGTKYRKLDTSDPQDAHLSQEVKNGWVAALQHHFVTAIVPPKDTSYRLTLSSAGDQYLLAAVGPPKVVAPGETGTFDPQAYIGPKLQSQLEATAPGLDLVADYGKLTILAKPLFWLLDKVHALTGNWGFAIIFVTFLLKLMFYPLSEASGRSMAKMKVLAPRIKNLQETYKDDREKLGKAMMELYQREKINPVAGCLPMIIQIPVFLAFYWVLLESVEMRQAPFAFWINDLSSRDPYFILPAIMAGAMFFQYKLNPPAQDPVQAKVFMIMPLVMSVTFAFFPAGLVLYWVTNTILSIAQQWNINRRIAAATKKT
jgi:YidC/Oxa1 family membrane protein insertase